MKKLIKKIEKKITNPRKSLPEDFFLFIGRMTPFTNVDLLIKNNKNETLLTWEKKVKSICLVGIYLEELFDFEKKSIQELTKSQRMNYVQRLSLVKNQLLLMKFI